MGTGEAGALPAMQKMQPWQNRLCVRLLSEIILERNQAAVNLAPWCTSCIAAFEADGDGAIPSGAEILSCQNR